MVELPKSIEQALERLAATSAARDGAGLKRTDESVLRIALDAARHEGEPAPIQTVVDRCHELRMDPDDVRKVTDWVLKAQAGRRLVPPKPPVRS